jgi:hypothetical protein
MCGTTCHLGWKRATYGMRTSCRAGWSGGREAGFHLCSPMPSQYYSVHPIPIPGLAALRTSPQDLFIFFLRHSQFIFSVFL